MFQGLFENLPNETILSVLATTTVQKERSHSIKMCQSQLFILNPIFQNCPYEIARNSNCNNICKERFIDFIVLACPLKHYLHNQVVIQPPTSFWIVSSTIF